MNRNITLLYGFSFFDQFMIVIALWVPYLATKGIGMRQFMELQAVFALVILCGESPSGVLSDLWGRKKTLLLGSTLKAVSFSLLPLWSSYESFLFYHLTMGIALSMISGGDVALLYDSHLAAGGEKSRGTAVLGNAKLAAQTGATVSALLGGAVVTLSYGHLLWANAILSWIPVLLVLRVTEPPAALDRGKKRAEELKEMLSTTLVRDAATRLVLLNLVAWGTGGLVMFWVNQKYWQESGVPLASFGVLLAGYGLIAGLAGRSAALGATRYGRRPLLAAVGVLPIIAYFGMASSLAQREDLLRVPRDRDLHGKSGNPRLLLSPGPPRGLWDRRLGTPVRLVGARNPVLDRVRIPDSAAGPEPGRQAQTVTLFPSIPLVRRSRRKGLLRGRSGRTPHAALREQHSFGKECYACHTVVKAKDYIFTSYPKR